MFRFEYRAPAEWRRTREECQNTFQPVCVPCLDEPTRLRLPAWPLDHSSAIGVLCSTLPKLTPHTSPTQCLAQGTLRSLLPHIPPSFPVRSKIVESPHFRPKFLQRMWKNMPLLCLKIAISVAVLRMRIAVPLPTVYVLRPYHYVAGNLASLLLFTYFTSSFHQSRQSTADRWYACS